jgi:hypothetical protein
MQNCPTLFILKRENVKTYLFPKKIENLYRALKEMDYTMCEEIEMEEKKSDMIVRLLSQCPKREITKDIIKRFCGILPDTSLRFYDIITEIEKEKEHVYVMYDKVTNSPIVFTNKQCDVNWEAYDLEFVQEVDGTEDEVRTYLGEHMYTLKELKENMKYYISKEKLSKILSKKYIITGNYNDRVKASNVLEFCTLIDDKVRKINCNSIGSVQEENGKYYYGITEKLENLNNNYVEYNKEYKPTIISDPWERRIFTTNSTLGPVSFHGVIDKIGDYNVDQTSVYPFESDILVEKPMFKEQGEISIEKYEEIWGPRQ